MVDILRVFLVLDPNSSIKIDTLQSILLDLYRDDVIMSDKNFELFSQEKDCQSSCFHETGFDLYSDRIAKKTYGYNFDEAGKL